MTSSTLPIETVLVPRDDLFNLVQAAFIAGESWRRRNDMPLEGNHVYTGKAAYDHADAATSQLAAAPPASPLVEVKGLEWKEDYGDWYAHTQIGIYSASVTVYAGIQGRFPMFNGKVIGNPCTSPDAAKGICQADFDTRITSCLAASADPAEPAQGVALEELERLVEALRRMVHWFDRYPEYKPNPEHFDKLAADIQFARAALSEARS